MLESKYQAGFGMIILGQNPLTFMIPIYSTTVLYDIYYELLIVVSYNDDFQTIGGDVVCLKGLHYSAANFRVIFNVSSKRL